MKYTTGPWSVKKSSPQSGIITAPNRSLGIAEVFGGGEADNANAALIAAAPELLEAIKGLYSSLAWHIQTNGGCGMDQHRMKQAEAAIKKATESAT